MDDRSTSRVLIREIKEWQEFISITSKWNGFRNWCFRGQSDARWALHSSLTRYVGISKVCSAAWPLQETRIRRIFERKSHLFLTESPSRDQLEWLALMQHHGAPTRLLDFTWSPYVAAFFALERATSDAVVWGINLPLLWDLHHKFKICGVEVVNADPRDPDLFEKYYLTNSRQFVWQGDPFRMPQRVVAQSGTFLVTSDLSPTLDEILADYPGSGTLLIKFVFKTDKIRTQAMASLYSMNITNATLFPGLDGLARSMAYEFEYSWQVDVKTNDTLPSLKHPQFPKDVFL
jgi:hypothetical protein